MKISYLSLLLCALVPTIIDGRLAAPSAEDGVSNNIPDIDQAMETDNANLHFDEMEQDQDRELEFAYEDADFDFDESVDEYDDIDPQFDYEDPEVDIDESDEEYDIESENSFMDDDEEGRKLQWSVVAPSTPKSKNLYAIPYEPGVTVRVSRDHISHTPANRIDMSGTSGGPYKIVAALDGVVKFIEDSHTLTGECADNNYVWLAHENGEWTKYSHLAFNSASGEAGLKVGDTVKVGQFLGYEDDVGCASGNHLHWEVAIPDNLADPIIPSGGYIKGKVCTVFRG